MALDQKGLHAMKNPFEEELLAMIQNIPRGRLTTYAELAWALDPRLNSEDVGRWLNGLCRDTALGLLGGDSAGTLPCWRVIDDEQASNLRLMNPDGITMGDVAERLFIRPLLDDGLGVEPPSYRIAREWLMSGPELQAAVRHRITIGQDVARDRVEFFRLRGEER